MRICNRMTIYNIRTFSLSMNLILCIMLLGCNSSNGQKSEKGEPQSSIKKDTPSVVQAPNPEPPPPPSPTLDTALYNKANMRLVNDSPKYGWPVKAEYPLPGAILPFKRVIAYYGNFYSTRMGILGELPPDEMVKKLQGEVKKWTAADPSTPAIPAIHYIAVTAQGAPGKGGKYILRMPFAQIDKAMEIAKKIDAIVFLDVQVGLSTVQYEIPQLEKYLQLPNVHLAIDPEFSMKSGKKPGTVIGTFDAADINYVTGYLAQLVKKNNLPPKMLVIHRFTQGMVTNYKQIKLQPEVQIVMDMDGWGFPAKKVNSYKLAIVREPVQYTGFKLFYKNDIKTPPWKTIMTPEEVLKKLYPKPIYIQYQ